jgi:hypothetical protein
VPAALDEHLAVARVRIADALLVTTVELSNQVALPVERVDDFLMIAIG